MTASTIYASATGEGLAALAVVRLSGPQAFVIASQLFGKPIDVRKAALRRLVDPRDGEVIDEAIVVLFESGASFTGEDVVEFHIHGGSAIRARLYDALEALGADYAKPGEFSQRRYRAGLFDLSQAEGLAALIAAETETQRRHAQSLLSGALGRRAAQWRRDLIDCMALLEAGIDFSEEDVGLETEKAAEAQLEHILQSFDAELSCVETDQLALTTPTAAIIGPPNAGKSTLFNALADNELAIVTPIAGTTRDALRTRIVVGGVAIELVDTAGIRESADPIERAGVDRAKHIADGSELRVIVLAADAAGDQLEISVLNNVRSDDLVIWNKSDIAPPPPFLRGFDNLIVTSREDRVSIDGLKDAIRRRLERAPTALSPISGSARRVRLYRAARDETAQALEALRSKRPEASVESLRRASRGLEAMLGRIDHEDVYSEIFSRFCIGK